MSKVYEALQHAQAERDVTAHTDSVNARALWKEEVVASSGLPLPRMEKEMGRLFQNVVRRLPDSQRGLIQFVGARKAEGTSTIVRESVLLVEGETSEMPQHRAFGVHPKVSLQGIIHDGKSLEEAISQVKNSRVFLCALAEEKGTHGRSTVSMNHVEIWNSLRKGFDFVLIDSPPIALSEESLVLCPHADGMILVIEAEKTRSQVAYNLKERVTKAGGKVLGCVFNKQRHYIPEWIYRRL